MLVKSVIFDVKEAAMSFNWSEFLAGSSVAAIVSELVKYYRKKSEVKINMAENVTDISRIHDIMQYTVDNSRYNRFLILQAEDSAGAIVAGKNIYVSCMYEKVCPEEPIIHKVADNIQRWKSDAAYYDTFSKLLTNGVTFMKVSDMPSCKLKDSFETMGVKSAIFAHLMTTKDNSKVFYACISSTIADYHTSDDRTIIDSSVDRIAYIFKKHRKYY